MSYTQNEWNWGDQNMVKVTKKIFTVIYILLSYTQSLLRIYMTLVITCHSCKACYVKIQSSTNYLQFWKVCMTPSHGYARIFATVAFTIQVVSVLVDCDSASGHEIWEVFVTHVLISFMVSLHTAESESSTYTTVNCTIHGFINSTNLYSFRLHNNA